MITNIFGDVYEHTLWIRAVVDRDLTITAKPAGQVVETSYGNYALMVEEGSSVTFAVNYGDAYGDELPMDYEWWIYSCDLQRCTTETPVCTDSVFVTNEPQNNCIYLCKVESNNYIEWTDEIRTHVIVTPRQIPDLEENTTIAEEAFAAMGIAEVRISVRISKIESRAFANCRQLQKVSFPNTEIAIADDAFEGCSNVRFYVYPGTSAEKYAIAHEIPVAYIGE